MHGRAVSTRRHRILRRYLTKRRRNTVLPCASRQLTGCVVGLLGRHPDRAFGRRSCHSCALACRFADLCRIWHDGFIAEGKSLWLPPRFELRIRSACQSWRCNGPWPSVLSEQHRISDRRCCRTSRHLNFSGDFSLADRTSQISLQACDFAEIKSSSGGGSPEASLRKLKRDKLWEERQASHLCLRTRS